MPSRSNTPPEFWGPAATVDGMPKTLADEALSRAMRKAWVAFAANGDPNTDGAPRWEPYRVAEDNHLVLSDGTHPGRDWRRGQLDFLERFFTRRAGSA